MPEPIVRALHPAMAAVIITIVAVPVLTMRLLSEEKRSGTLEVLLTAPVDEGADRPEQVPGRLRHVPDHVAAVWSVFGVSAHRRRNRSSTIDRCSVSPSVWLATGAAFISMGVFFSSLTRSQVASGVLTGGGMFMLTLIFSLARLVRDSMASSAWKGVSQAHVLHRRVV